MTIGDHLYVARYILYRLAELYGLRVTFSPIPVPGEAFTSAGHLNFSTSRMRQKGGIELVLSRFLSILLNVIRYRVQRDKRLFWFSF